MSLVPLADLPGDARLWCFAADPAPDPATADRLLAAVREFAETWAAHGADLRAGAEWVADRVLCLAVDERAAGVSGCSIDALTGRLRALEEELGISLLDGGSVRWRDPDGRPRTASRERFRTLAREGRVGPDTPVLDLTLPRLADLRDGRLERPASASWHARLLPVPSP
ncbi:MAG: hypothetical protein RRA92_04700 [Gemmatimonadota bacterium]|nr:hypothetical protein [Gemmatimonadota bacterium]